MKSHVCSGGIKQQEWENDCDLDPSPCSCDSPQYLTFGGISCCLVESVNKGNHKITLRETLMRTLCVLISLACYVHVVL